MQAKAEVWISKKYEKNLKNIDMSEIGIVSSSKINILNDDNEEIKVDITLAEGEKCKRCWKVLPEVDTICKRCKDVI